MTDSEIDQLVIKIKATPEGKLKQFLWNDLYNATRKILRKMSNKYCRGKNYDSAEKQAAIDQALMESVKGFDIKKGRFVQRLNFLARISLTNYKRKVAQQGSSHNNECNGADFEDRINSLFAKTIDEIEASDGFSNLWDRLENRTSHLEILAIEQVVLNGKTYEQAGRIAKVNAKAIDNALQRAKKRIIQPE